MCIGILWRLSSGDGLCTWLSIMGGGPACRAIKKPRPRAWYQLSSINLSRIPPPLGVAEKRVMIIYNIYKYTTHPFWHSKDLGPIAYRLSPTQRQNRASLLPIRAHEGPEVEEMTAYRGQYTNDSRKFKLPSSVMNLDFTH